MAPEYVAAVYAAGGQKLWYIVTETIDDAIEAIKYLKEIIGSGYKLPLVYNNLGLAYFRVGEVKKAKTWWQKTLKNTTY